MSRVYKILSRRAWEEAEADGAYIGSPLDVQDGFIHLSTAAQTPETARLHFCGQRDLIVVGFDAEAFGDALKWEPSRGGSLFPHLYAALPTAGAVSIDPLPLDADSAPVTPRLVE
jgi:uncharacterized protein (DUF952 family)